MRTILENNKKYGLFCAILRDIGIKKTFWNSLKCEMVNPAQVYHIRCTWLEHFVQRAPIVSSDHHLDIERVVKEMIVAYYESGKGDKKDSKESNRLEI